MNNIQDILITDEAKNDILEIFNYISSDNIKASKELINTFFKTFEFLKNYPCSGLKKYGIQDKSIRIYIVKKNYAVAYRIKNNNIEIVRVLTRYQNLLTIL